MVNCSNHTPPPVAWMLPALLLGLFLPLPAVAAERVTTDEQGRSVVIPASVRADQRNPWPTAYEAALRQRQQLIFNHFRGAIRQDTVGEREKKSYPATMLAWYAEPEDRAAAIKALQAEDAEAHQHAHTEGIDWYWSHALGGQIRKYFHFGPYLDKDYRQRMYRAAQAWVAEDPRPSSELVLLLDSQLPEVVDYAQQRLAEIWRDGDDIRALADAAAAEYAANPSAPQAHRKRAFSKFMRGFAKRVGSKPPTSVDQWRAWWADLTSGDWLVYEEYDRRVNLRPHPNYGIGSGPVGASPDPSTRGGVVDWRNTDAMRAMRTTAIYLMAEETGDDLLRSIYQEHLRQLATWYLSIGNGEWESETHHGHLMAGYLNLYDFAKDETVRGYAKAILDYLSTAAAYKYFHGLHAGPNKRDYGDIGPFASPAQIMWLWAGGTSHENTDPDSSLAYPITSAYRPPAAVVALARKKFSLPLEMHSNKPHYQLWLPGNDRQAHHHETMYVAPTYQMASLRKGGSDDTSGCKIAVSDGAGGAHFFIPSLQKQGNLVSNRNRDERHAQYHNLLLTLKRPRRGSAPLRLLLPRSSTIEQVEGITFIRFAQTWAAVTPINARLDGPQPERLGDYNKLDQHDSLTLWGGPSTGTIVGYAIEMGDHSSHSDYQAFRQAVLANSTLNLESLASDGSATFTGSRGRTLKLQWQPGDNERIFRDGEELLPENQQAVFHSRTTDGTPLTLKRNHGVLRVEAGGHRFIGRFDLDSGTYTSEHQLAE